MKKYLALTLILALVLAVMAPVNAFAADKTEDTGDAAIEIINDLGPPVIVDPEDPDPEPELPGDPGDWDQYVVAGLDFGVHDLSVAMNGFTGANALNSQKWAGRDEENGTKLPGREAAPETTGFIIRNGEFDGWSVTVKMGAFMTDDTTPVETLLGFKLTLNKLTDKIHGNTAPAVVNPKVELQKDTTAELVKALPNTGIGYFAYDYDGDLDIPVNAVRGNGTNQAVMTWSVAAVPVTP